MRPIIVGGPIGDTSPLAAVYVEGNSCVVVSQAERLGYCHWWCNRPL